MCSGGTAIRKIIAEQEAKDLMQGRLKLFDSA